MFEICCFRNDWNQHPDIWQLIFFQLTKWINQFNMAALDIPEAYELKICNVYLQVDNYNTVGTRSSSW